MQPPDAPDQAALETALDAALDALARRLAPALLALWASFTPETRAAFGARRSHARDDHPDHAAARGARAGHRP